MDPETREERKLRKRNPHPTVGWICVMPIPDPDGDAVDEDRRRAVEVLGPFALMMARSRGDEIRSGVVLEVGPPPEGQEYEPFAQDAAGRTIYYGANVFVEVDGYHFVAVANVICWDPSPEDDEAERRGDS